MIDIKVFYEYSRIENDSLKNTILNTPTLEKYFTLDFKGLKTKQYCGILHIDNQDIYLLPKIAKGSENNLDIFIYMLMYSYNIKLENEDIASCENESNTILEVFIQIFAQRLFKEFKFGVYKEYITQKENLTTLRGKYLINENLKYNFVKNRIYCEYDEFSENNKLNQFFLYALTTLLRYTKNKKLLKQCELVLDEVEYREFDIRNLNIHFNRLSRRYADKYQMFVYGINFGVKHTMLLYPQHIARVKEDLELGKDDKMIELKMRSIDLDFDGGYGEFLEEIRKRVGEL